MAYAEARGNPKSNGVDVKFILWGFVVLVCISTVLLVNTKSILEIMSMNIEVQSSARDKMMTPLFHTIPHNLFFTYKYDILKTKDPAQFYSNIMNTVDIYRAASSNLSAPVYFMTDADCRDTIRRVEPKLLQHFDNEEKGMYKADICRIVALYEKGGYYFDVDIEVIEAVQMPGHVGFATCHETSRKGFFQAFLAAKPGHPILKEATNKMTDYYEGRLRLHSFLGPSTLKDAYEALSEEARQDVMLLEETSLDSTSRWHQLPRRREIQDVSKKRKQPNIPRPCNFVVHGQHRAHFWSRILGLHCEVVPARISPHHEKSFYNNIISRWNIMYSSK